MGKFPSRRFSTIAIDGDCRCIHRESFLQSVLTETNGFTDG
jgi:hypothetical protein